MPSILRRFATPVKSARFASQRRATYPRSSRLDQVLETDHYRYVFVSHLAEGGMGSIYLGRRVSTPGGTSTDKRSTEVVLKQLLPEHSADPKLIDMFLREWRVTSQLDHHNIVRTLDAVTAGDDYYIVLEYVRGGDVRAIMRRAKRRQAKLSVASAMFVASEVLAALAYAHGKRDDDGRPLGLIHRDVSPSNILLGVDGTVKLTDFGIAKAPTQGSVMFKVKGKLGYMSPEQARGEPVDLRADIFAVGVVLYEMLVGERLFIGQMGQAAAVFSQPVRAPSKKRADLPPGLDEVVLRALSLDPVGRFSSAAEFSHALARIAELDRMTLGENALATDLRRCCGDDSAGWRNLEVPVTATLDAGSPGEGTGVIVTDDEDDDFEDRPLTGSRPAILPNKELKSVVHFVRRDLSQPFETDLPATTVARDPFAPRAQPAKPAARAPVRPAHQPAPPTDERIAFTRTDFAINTPAELPRPSAKASAAGRSEPPRSDYEDEDSAVRTRVQGADALLRRASASTPPASHSRPEVRSETRPARTPPVAPSPPRASASQNKAPLPNTQFAPPVPRPSVPPPSLSELDEPEPRAAPPEEGATRSAPPASRSTPPASRSTPPAARSTPPAARSTPPPSRSDPAASAAPGATRLTHMPEASASGARNPSAAPLPPARAFEDEPEATARPRAMGPASLAALERNLGGRPFAKGALAVVLILLLVALGIGLGVLLSGPSGAPGEPNLNEVTAPAK
jgi:serine/threonine protein kinase